MLNTLWNQLDKRTSNPFIIFVRKVYMKLQWMVILRSNQKKTTKDVFLKGVESPLKSVKPKKIETV